MWYLCTVWGGWGELSGANWVGLGREGVSTGGLESRAAVWTEQRGGNCTEARRH